MSNRISESKQAATLWLKLIDAGQYADGWNITGKIFRDAISCTDWEEKIQAVRGNLELFRNVKNPSHSRWTPLMDCLTETILLMSTVRFLPMVATWANASQRLLAMMAVR